MLKSILLAPALLALAGAPLAAAVTIEDGHVHHVLLISIDGMHAQDLTNWVTANPTSNIGKLYASGINYTGALTGGGVLSDSFPGLCALVTGGFPGSTGLWYDDAYDRSLFAPGAVLPGLETNLAEPLDFDNNFVDAGVTHNGGTPLYDASGINPANLPVNLPTITGGPTPTPVWPHQIQRLNTIFEVVHNAGMYTAWCDKHPAYEWVKGPSGTGLNDFYAPEINSFCEPNGTPQPSLTGAGAGSGISGTYTGAASGPGSYAVVNPGGWDMTNAMAAVEQNDSLKVAAIINQIDGKTALGNATTPANTPPNLFGMNFQALSVAQKLRHDPSWNASGPQGGYTSAAGTYAAGGPLANAMAYLDVQIGSMVTELTNKGLYNSTLIILTAKHGQTPVDETLLSVENAAYIGAAGKVVLDPITGDNQIANVLQGATVDSGIPVAFAIEDDVSLIWLQNPTQVAEAVALLQLNASAFNIQTIYSGSTLQTRYHVVAGDPRAPDIIIQPVPGTIYNSGKKKIAEHGGAAPTDMNVALLVSTPGLAQGTVTDTVLTTEVAPMIVKSLGLSASLLLATSVDGTPDLETTNGQNGGVNSTWTNPNPQGTPGAPGAMGATGATGSNGKCGAGGGTALIAMGLLGLVGLRRFRSKR